MTREEKIKALKNLAAGRITADDFLPKNLKLRILKNGRAIETEKLYRGKPVSEERFAELVRTQTDIIIKVSRI